MSKHLSDSKITSHHIIPRSRIKKGQKIPNNIVKVSHLEHDRYHQLFGNKTPEEILLYLVQTFWGNNTGHIHKFLWEYEK